MKALAEEVAVREESATEFTRLQLLLANYILSNAQVPGQLQQFGPAERQEFARVLQARDHGCRPILSGVVRMRLLLGMEFPKNSCQELAEFIRICQRTDARPNSIWRSPLTQQRLW